MNVLSLLNFVGIITIIVLSSLTFHKLNSKNTESYKASSNCVPPPHTDGDECPNPHIGQDWEAPEGCPCGDSPFGSTSCGCKKGLKCLDGRCCDMSDPLCTSDHKN